jgi:hypothetical protein
MVRVDHIIGLNKINDRLEIFDIGIVNCDTRIHVRGDVIRVDISYQFVRVEKTGANRCWDNDGFCQPVHSVSQYIRQAE